MTSVTASRPVEMEVRIAARPETVFALISTSEGIKKWMGRSVVFEPTPGGALRVDVNGKDIASGKVLEVSPPNRVRFSWGWEGAGHPIPPGSSIVEITLAADGSGTILRLTHSDLPAEAMNDHAEGWKHYTARLATVATGGNPGPDSHDMSEPARLAGRLEGLLGELRTLVANASPAAWSATTAENWSAGATSHHIITHLNLAEFAAMVAAGQPSPLGEFTLEQLEAGNAAHAVEFAKVTQADVLATLDAAAPRAVGILRALTDEGLAASQRMAFAGGNPVSVRDLVQGPLLENIEAHLANVRAVLGS